MADALVDASTTSTGSTFVDRVAPLDAAPGQDVARSIIVGVLERGVEPPEAFFASGTAAEIYKPMPFADPGMGPRGKIILDLSAKRALSETSAIRARWSSVSSTNW